MEFVHRFHKYFGFIVSSLQFSLQVLIYNLDKIHTGKIHTSEKATKFEKKSPIIFDITGNVKKWEIFSNFVAFSEYLNFKIEQTLALTLCRAACCIRPSKTFFSSFLLF